MYKLKPEPQFTKDYLRFKRQHPELVRDLMDVLEQLHQNGVVRRAYNPYLLSNRGGNYNGNDEFHLSNGKVDVIVIYRPHHTNQVIRLIRIGTHSELFQGKYR